MFQSFSILLLLVAVFSLLNQRTIKLPNSIALMILGVFMALAITIIKPLFPEVYDSLCELIVNANFEDLLFNALLSFLLFAGAIHVDFGKLLKQKKFIISFATLSVLLSTFLVAVLLYGVALLVQVELDFVHALMFGALISPTDPVAALAILKKTSIKEELIVAIEGESLFNDGVGVVVFSGVLIWFNSLSSMESTGISYEILTLFLEEVVGGIVFGLALGYGGYLLIKAARANYELKLISSLAVASAGYSIALALEVSAPLAMVVAGILIGNKLHLNTEKDEAHEFFNKFWNVLDEVLNGVLFLLIGLSLHLITFSPGLLLIGILTILLVLLSRYISVLIPYSIFKSGAKEKGVVSILSWGGLRGGISLGLAMSLPESEMRDIIIFLTFVVVAFSIIVQGLTIDKLVKRFKV